MGHLRETDAERPYAELRENSDDGWNRCTPNPET